MVATIYIIASSHGNLTHEHRNSHTADTLWTHRGHTADTLRTLPSFLPFCSSFLLFFSSSFLRSGRVKLASKKNFLLSVRPDDHWLEEEFGTKPILRFGKVTKDRFALDYRYPLSAYTALGIALSAFANKLVVT